MSGAEMSEKYDFILFDGFYRLYRRLRNLANLSDFIADYSGKGTAPARFAVGQMLG